MLHWLVQTTEAHPDLEQGIPPAGMLSPQEQFHFAGLKTEKRRRDWLIGRWTAKKLVQVILLNSNRFQLPLAHVTIENWASGEPYILAPTLPVTLSISHSHNRALCALVEHPNWPLGVDLERISSRDQWFAEDYFTPDEQAVVRNTPLAERPTLVTAIWSAKEATLKALHLGLTVDTRCVSCPITPSAAAYLDWVGFPVELDHARLNRPIPPLVGWWRVVDHFVLTLVVQTSPIGNLIPHDRNGYN